MATVDGAADPPKCPMDVTGLFTHKLVTSHTQCIPQPGGNKSVTYPQKVAKLVTAGTK